MPRKFAIAVSLKSPVPQAAIARSKVGRLTREASDKATAKPLLAGKHCWLTQAKDPVPTVPNPRGHTEHADAPTNEELVLTAHSVHGWPEPNENVPAEMRFEEEVVKENK